MPPEDVSTAPRVDTLDVRLGPPSAALADPQVKVLSFDVFDTLLWRRVPDPVDAFDLVADALHELELLPRRVDPRVFTRLRIAAEQRARNKRLQQDGRTEITLPDIYAQLAPSEIFGDKPDLAARVAAEVQVERDLLVPDLDIAALLDAAREQGKQIVAVSDTYFSRGDVEQFLVNRGLEIDRIFVSSAFGYGKTTGLWNHVFESLDVEPAAIVHVGDNEDADVKAPRELGVRPFLFARRDKQLDVIFAREGRLLERPVVEGHGDFGLTALRSKVLHRQELASMPPELPEFWRYGATALGPALTGFAEWVQERTRAAGGTRALCLMREGVLLAELIEAAGAAVPDPISAEPIWLSRQTLARASIFQGTRFELDRLLTRRSAPTVRELCATLDLDAGRIASLAGRADARLSDVALRRELFGVLTEDPELRTHVVDVGAQARARVLRYVEHVRVPGEDVLVLVDLGWQGTVQSMLNEILQAERVALSTVGLYLVTHAGAVDKQLAGADIQGYLGESGEPKGEVSAIVRSPEVLEQVCMPDHGSQVDLTPELAPVLADQAPEGVLQAAERHAVQQGIRAFQREWVRYRTVVPDALPPLAGAEPLLRAQVARGVTAPTAGEARVFGAWLHDENFGSVASDAIAGPDLVPALRHMDPQTLIEIPMSELYWPFGLAALHDEHLARAAELVALDVLPWQAFGSPLETGDIEIFYDAGWGFVPGQRVEVRGRRNRFGLTFARARITAEDVVALRLDPCQSQAIVRLDSVTLRGLRQGDGAPLAKHLTTPQELAALGLHHLHWLSPKVLQTHGEDPHIRFDVPALLGARVYEVELECAMAILPTLPPTPGEKELERRTAEARRSVRRFELRTGMPITPVARRARGLLRKLRS